MDANKINTKNRVLPLSSRRTLAAMKNNLSYRYTDTIARGKFSDIVSFKDRYAHLRAGKIMSETNMKEVSLEFWPILDNNNLLKLEETIFIPRIPSYCFVTEKHFTNLEQIFDLSLFKEDPNNMDDFKRWLLDILSGVDHLHRNSLCHLNLEGSNILITYNSNAKIAGFSRISLSTEPVPR